MVGFRVKTRVCVGGCLGVCVCDFVWYVSARIFLGRWFTVSSSLRGLSLVEELLTKTSIQLWKYKIKLKTTEPVNLLSFAIWETEAQGKLKQGKGTCLRSQTT